ncbi:MAG: bifunctional precorrin-2 dehydrogenase/sirohydrochlorin ferrochelatase [Chloroflexi bacterium]|nr:bifunctional precorrin-2 dehydrogenase/sirohydrochlorin ferrochelatase [Chloroflexota bacterium]
MSDHYPVFLNLSGRTCVVVGGGEVAERKAKTLLESGARVRVVSPRITEGLKSLSVAGAVEVAAHPFESGDLEGASLVIAATSDAGINRQVALEAEKRRLLVNVVDVPSQGNFIVPSVVQKDGLVVAVSTGGRSPALARKLRQELEKTFVPKYAMLLGLVARVRQDLKSRGIRVAPDAWQTALDGELMDLVARGEMEAARHKLVTSLEKWNKAP